MGADRALNLLDQMLWAAAVVSGPILGAILIVGVLISILQVATQVQEMTLTFVPKLVVVTLLLIFLGSWMVGRLTQFAEAMLLTIPGLVR
jgi:flagellar biosynthetic protein FliQ